jgi:methylase of polypeptide subunit release factors
MDKSEKKIINWDGIQLVYSDINNGGGLYFKNDFLNSVKKVFGNKKFDRVLEWCSGPGFLGYSLLANNICQNLTLSDIHISALQEAHDTAILNNIADRVKIYHSDVWDNVPDFETFDLIIANPPWYSSQNYWNERLPFESRIYLDTDWMLHKKFFKKAKDHLNDNGSILLLEGSYGSGINTFQEMIADSGLVIKDHFLGEFRTDNFGKFSYYIHVKPND